VPGEPKHPLRATGRLQRNCSADKRVRPAIAAAQETPARRLPGGTSPLKPQGPWGQASCPRQNVWLTLLRTACTIPATRGRRRAGCRQTDACFGAHGTALGSPRPFFALGRGELTGRGRLGLELSRGLPSSDGRIISRCGRPHFGHFNSRMTCPAWSSLTKSPSRRLHSRQRTCVWVAMPMVTAPLRLRASGAPYSENVGSKPTAARLSRYRCHH
jgi:hypothetical protein